MISISVEHLTEQIKARSVSDNASAGLLKHFGVKLALIESSINSSILDRISKIPKYYFTTESERTLLESDDAEYKLKVDTVQTFSEDSYEIRFACEIGGKKTNAKIRVDDPTDWVWGICYPITSIHELVYSPNDSLTISLLGFNGKSLFYYTNASYAIDDYMHGHIHVSQILNVNDPNEWMPKLLDESGQPLSYEEVAKIARNPYYRNLGMISFSKSWNIAPMWGQYADKFKGVVFEIAVHPENIVEVSYANKNSDLRVCCKANEYSSMFDKIRSAKSSDWSYEQECRSFLPLNPAVCTLNNGRYFTRMQVGINNETKAKFRLERIICGPNMPESEVEQLRFIWISRSHSVSIEKTEFDTDSYKLRRVPYLS